MSVYSLPYFPAIEKENILENFHIGNFKNIRIHLYIESISVFEENIISITEFLENVKIISAKIKEKISEQPDEINDFYKHLLQSKKVKSYAEFINRLEIENIYISIINNVLSFLFNFNFEDTEISINVSKNGTINNIHLDWGGYSIKKSEIITYPPEELNHFVCVTYEYIDNLNFMLKPSECIRNAEPYLAIAKKRFLEQGWEGDGVIQLLWLPPFVFKDGNDDMIYGGGFDDFSTQGTVLWHVKQSKDGISWLLMPKKVAEQLKIRM